MVSTENITQNWYHGRDRSMLIPNTIFRLGGAAVLLTSCAAEKARCKYRLEHLVRVHLGADDAAYRCIFQAPDAAGSMGVALSKDIVKVAARAMTANLTRLGEGGAASYEAWLMGGCGWQAGRWEGEGEFGWRTGQLGCSSTWFPVLILLRSSVLPNPANQHALLRVSLAAHLAMQVPWCCPGARS